MIWHLPTRKRRLDQAIASATQLNTTTTRNPPDAINTLQTTQPQYLVGLRVTGKKIVILLDRSASMTARDLVKIVQYKAGPAPRASSQKMGQRADAVWWMTARAPAQSQMHIAILAPALHFIPRIGLRPATARR